MRLLHPRIIVSFLALTACGKAAPNNTPSPIAFGRIDPSVVATAGSQTLAHDLRSGALVMHAQMQNLIPQTNTVLSPYAVQAAMGMMDLSAQGNTVTDMQNAMRWTQSPTDLGSSFGILDTLIATGVASNPNTTLNTATRMWVAKTLTVVPNYGQAVEDDFSASIVPMDFSQATAATQEINSWVAQQTNDIVTDLLSASALQGGANLVQTATLFFTSVWQTTFTQDTSVPTPFYRADGSTSRVEMMHSTASFPYASTSTYTAVDILYDRGAMGLLIVMPTGDMNTFVQSLDANALETLQAGLNPNLLQLSVPPFSVTQAPASVTAILQAMGLSVSLSDQADFVVFDPNAAPPEKIASIFEQATIQVDKNGTLAVAAAGVVATPTGVGVPPGTPIPCTIDHPYLYFVHDTVTNTILFMGVIGDASDR